MVAIPNQNIIAQLDPTTGSLYGTFPAPGTRATAVGSSGPSPRFIADPNTHIVYSYGVPIITSLSSPVGMDNLIPGGDDPIPLFVVDDATDRFYYFTEDTGIQPASFGRVKALFR